MLRGIRKASSNWFGKLIMATVMGVLVISFAIWGIGDIFRGFGARSVAKVGGSEISIEQFRQLYNDRLQLLSRQLQRPITPDQARAFGLDRQLLTQYVNDLALDNRARALRLGLSDAEIAKRITEDANFRSVMGQFDRRRFELIIRNAGYTEARYVAEQRRQSLRRQIAESIGGEVAVPKSIADALNRYDNEQRSIEYAILDHSKAGEIPAPTAEDLDKYFQERKALFRAPEFRKVSVLTLSQSDLARWITVSDEDARQLYEARKDRYSTPERRQVQLISFPNMEAATAAAQRLAAGTTFEALAAERNATGPEFDLGLVTKASIVDPGIAQGVFALKEGEVSQPIQGTFKVGIARVVKIEPERSRPYEEVAAELKNEIALDRAKADMLAKHDKIEDERASGTQLNEVAVKLGLTAHTVDAVDRSGRDPSGNPVPDLPPGVDILGPIFSTAVGVETEPVQLPGGAGYAWFELLQVTPSHERTLDEAKAQVEARWRDDQTAERVRTKAAELIARLKAGTSLADLATAEGLKIETAPALKRGTPAATIAPRVLEAVFRTQKDGVDSAPGQNAGDQVLFRVTDIATPPFDASSADGKRIDETLRRSFSDDLILQYITNVRNDIGVSINEAALRQAAGGGAPE